MKVTFTRVCVNYELDGVRRSYFYNSMEQAEREAEALRQDPERTFVSITTETLSGVE